MWLKEPFTDGQAWIDLVMNANHKDGSFFVRGVEVQIKRGQIGWSEVTMAKRWKWSRTRVRRYVKRLESVTQVIQQKIHKITTVITIINYEKYQGDTSNDTTDDTTDDTQTRMIKNDKELLVPLGSEKNMGKFRSYNEDQHYEDNAIDLETGEALSPKGKEKKKTRAVDADILEVFELFNNPAKALWRMREVERVAAKVLFDTYGIEKLKIRIGRIEEEKKKKDPYFPEVNTPSQLLDKMSSVERYFGI